METKKSHKTLRTIGFYNVENLFDIRNDKATNDDYFTKKSPIKWTKQRYNSKLKKIGHVISAVGKEETHNTPAIFGLAEVENTKVIEDLIASEHLKDYTYKYIHFNSKDERGIDVALVYDTSVFKVAHSEIVSYHFDDNGNTDYTRDILLVSGLLDGLELHCIVNHWSSRREGVKESNHKRVKAAQKVNDLIKSIRTKSPNAKIVVMGDFNDNPGNDSVQNLVNESQLHNVTAALRSYSRGTVFHKRQWYLFDQILLSTNFFEEKDNSLQFNTANIYDPDFLKTFKGRQKGSPFRTYKGRQYQGGYSDHFPVYVVLEVE